MKINIVNKSGLELPRYMSDGAACMDICVSVGARIEPNETELVRTGLFVEIPRGWCMMLFERSSLHKHGLDLSNGVGIIDSDYRGEILIPLHNKSDGVTITVNRGARVAQAMLKKVERIEWNEVEELSKTERDSDGFGSTGE